MGKGWQSRTYYNVNPIVGVSMHDSMGPIPLPPFFGPAWLPHVQIDVVQGIWLGSFLSKRNEKAIFSEGLLFVGRASDAGFVVPHISFPPSWYNLLTTAFGSSMALFGASSVTVACKNLLWGNQDSDIAATPFGKAPFSLNLSCSDPISFFTDIVVVWGSVYVGMTWDDIAAAAIDFAINLAMEVGGAVAGKAGGALWKKALGGSKVGPAATKLAQSAAFTQGVKSAIEMSDDDLARYVSKKSATQGVDKAYSTNLKKVMGDYDEAAAALKKKYGKQWDQASRGHYGDGVEKAEEVLDAANKAGVGAEGAKAVVKSTVLDEGLRDMDDAITKIAAATSTREMTKKLLKKAASKAIYKNLTRYGNILGSGTEGGLLSFDGFGWTNQFQINLRWQEKYDELDFIGDPDEQWDIAYVDSNDDDYWYSDGAEADETETEADDYWFDEDDDDASSAAGASAGLVAATPGSATPFQVTT